jgi:hypothetical protein
MIVSLSMRLKLFCAVKVVSVEEISGIGYVTVRTNFADICGHIHGPEILSSGL